MRLSVALARIVPPFHVSGHVFSAGRTHEKNRKAVISFYTNGLNHSPADPCVRGSHFNETTHALHTPHYGISNLRVPQYEHVYSHAYETVTEARQPLAPDY